MSNLFFSPSPSSIFSVAPTTHFPRSLSLWYEIMFLSVYYLHNLASITGSDFFFFFPFFIIWAQVASSLWVRYLWVLNLSSSLQRKQNPFSPESSFSAVNSIIQAETSPLEAAVSHLLLLIKSPFPWVWKHESTPITTAFEPQDRNPSSFPGQRSSWVRMRAICNRKYILRA